MGRKKRYDPDDVLDKAVTLFRRQGFHNTSTEELAAHLGINRNSMYQEFRSKQKLFEAALERYYATDAVPNCAALVTPEAGLLEIREFFARFASAAYSANHGVGCLLCNTATERAPLDPGSAVVVHRYLRLLTESFGRALQNAQRNGELGVGVDTAPLADFLTSSVLGFRLWCAPRRPPNRSTGRASRSSAPSTRGGDALGIPEAAAYLLCQGPCRQLSRPAARHPSSTSSPPRPSRFWWISGPRGVGRAVWSHR